LNTFTFFKILFKIKITFSRLFYELLIKPVLCLGGTAGLKVVLSDSLSKFPEVMLPIPPGDIEDVILDLSQGFRGVAMAQVRYNSSQRG
jgi:hypothetical protein